MAWLQGTRKVIAVEPEQSCALHSAMKSNQPVDVTVSGIASNALGAKKAGNICFELAKAQQIKTLLLKDSDIAFAQKLLWNKFRQFVEPAASTALAAITSGTYIPEKDEKIAILICGANPPLNPFD